MLLRPVKCGTCQRDDRRAARTMFPVKGMWQHLLTAPCPLVTHAAKERHGLVSMPHDAVGFAVAAACAALMSLMAYSLQYRAMLGMFLGSGGCDACGALPFQQ